MKREFQLLHSKITLKTENKNLQAILDFVSQDAKQSFAYRNEAIYAIEETKIGYRIQSGGATYKTSDKQWELAYRLLGLAHRQAFKESRDFVRIHAACANYNNARFLVVGEKGAGKTTLMLRLLLERKGFRVYGDELVLIRGLEGMPFPRRFHVKTGSLSLLPSIAPYVKNSPGFFISGLNRLYGFSPVDANCDWMIDSQHIDAIFYLKPNHGEKTTLETCSGIDMMQNIMPMSYYMKSRKHKKINILCRVVNNSASYVLHNGNLEQTVVLIQKEMEHISTL